MTRVLAVLAAVLLAPAPAAAQGLMLELHGGYFDMTNAGRSASAVFGTSGGAVIGGAAAYDLNRRLTVSVGGRVFNKTGERVFVAAPDRPAFRLGHPLEVRIAPVEASLAYRFRPGRRLEPYAGAGAGFAAFRETSTVAGLRTTEEQTKASAHVLAGAEWGRGRLRGGVELRYGLVPDTIGVGGVSKVYGEDDVGGLAVTAKVVFRVAGERRR